MTASAAGDKRAPPQSAQARVILVAPQFLAQIRRIGFAPAPLDRGDDAVEFDFAPLAAVGDFDFAVVAEQNKISVFFRQAGERLLQIDAVFGGERAQDGESVFVARIPTANGAGGDRQGGMLDDEIGIENLHMPKPAAAPASALRIVEREQLRLQFRRRVAAARAGVASRKLAHLAVFEIENADATVAERSRGFDRFEQAAARIGGDADAIDDGFDRVLDCFGESRDFFDRVDFAVDARSREAAPGEVGEQFDIFAFAPDDERGEHGDAPPVFARQQKFDDLLRALRPQGEIVARAMRLAHPREQKAQVVVNLGDRADRRARVVRRAFLIDRNRRRQPFDGVDIGLFHHLQKLARVSRKRFDIAPLAFGEIVSNASDDLPDPESPVTTTKRSRGMLTWMFLRLWTRAPLTRMKAVILFGFENRLLCLFSSPPRNVFFFDRAAGGRRARDGPRFSDVRGVLATPIIALAARAMTPDPALVGLASAPTASRKARCKRRPVGCRTNGGASRRCFWAWRFSRSAVFVAAAADSIWQLIGGRFLQGGGAVAAVVAAWVADVTAPKTAPKEWPSSAAGHRGVFFSLAAGRDGAVRRGRGRAAFLSSPPDSAGGHHRRFDAPAAAPASARRRRIRARRERLAVARSGFVALVFRRFRLAFCFASLFTHLPIALAENMPPASQWKIYAPALLALLAVGAPMSRQSDRGRGARSATVTVAASVLWRSA